MNSKRGPNHSRHHRFPQRAVLATLATACALSPLAANAGDDLWVWRKMVEDGIQSSSVQVHGWDAKVEVAIEEPADADAYSGLYFVSETTHVYQDPDAGEPAAAPVADSDPLVGFLFRVELQGFDPDSGFLDVRLDVENTTSDRHASLQIAVVISQNEAYSRKDVTIAMLDNDHLDPGETVSFELTGIVPGDIELGPHSVGALALEYDRVSADLLQYRLSE